MTSHLRFIIPLLFLLISCTKPIPKNKRIYAKGEIVKISYHKSGSCNVKFYDSLQNEHIGHYIHKIHKLRIGENYWIAYDKNNIENVNVYFTAPIVQDSLNYISSQAMILSNNLDEFFNSNYCSFSYSYNGKRYNRYQHLVNKSIKKGDNVELLINKNRPEIAYIKGSSAITK
ncbi:hypothetical protein QWY87_11670 [Lutimonas halocynthiae]|uniref:hypothetical protein n=1 Tax=Lutimonas halocynthiae TaxID=1446477 RepID=UPI0025B4FF6F|nr:hypothetical protein [Lutimonas halocynthiae]MDN3643363.1 hypothetical protein [Lutimonas halocynthiae]